ncbi:hypothetical protein [Parageobacillus sp. G301]|uniref:hypothetical protein n=1 Tax=Parageobacillus sp. G301 TaxID=2998290 RepID=UPI0024967BCF|nr:hypothetical protein [Parageobacillus sp. G301]GLH64499.1 hypothetical protein PG301_23380 [Parageobacillus sp. G301]
MNAKCGWNKFLNKSMEDDSTKLKILKSYRTKLFVLIILTIVIDISDFVTKDASFLSGLLTGIVLVFCTVAFSISYKLSKRIENRIRMNKK